jgi:FMN-dependent NADH-azoreductase
MTTVLHIDSSAERINSKSRATSAQVVHDLTPTQVIRRDLAADSLPFIDNDWVKARLVPLDAQTDADRKTLAVSDMLVAELQAADTIVIGVPLYNFSGPATLKAWIDLVARPKVTFRYETDGPVGLLVNKRAIIVAASGGVPIGTAQDHLTPHLTTFLAFLGITDVTIIHAT